MESGRGWRVLRKKVAGPRPVPAAGGRGKPRCQVGTASFRGSMRFYATGPSASAMIRNNMLQAVSSPLPPGGDPFEGTPYCWLRRVGGGGMGEVHLVQHAMLGSE